MQHTQQPTTSIRGPLRRAGMLTTSVVAISLLAACASRNAPLEPLQKARAAVNTAMNDAKVVQLAPLELKSATDTLAQADTAWTKEADATEATHLSNLAVRRAQIAQNVAQTRQLDADIKQAGVNAERQRLQGDAARAQQQADQARAAAAASATAADRARQQTQAAQAQVKDLQARLNELQAQQTERGLLVTLGDVLFEFGKAELTSQAAPRLDKLAQFLTEFPNRKLLIEGYTDSVGTAAANQTLSERRAASVQSALASRGVAADRMTVRGYGKDFPVADNASPEGRAMNRRVEIVIADENGNLRSRR
ncbi:OmpA family protein [Diaphorobacter aerolatus]|uniref:OmpA family protein n=1 Tax=Diaphorobacter aerolatus TaxID=1288495 RepID=UPI001D018F33|nr:OmpA family protein [Diaphorobacter aerolatus]